MSLWPPQRCRTVAAMPATRVPDTVPSVSVIMPTLARPQRARSLRAAVDSVLSQSGVRATPLVVVNGAEYDRSLVAELSGRAGVRVTMLPTADLPGALHAGRERVDTPWFAELDDDDLLVEGTLAGRLALMRDDPGIDVVVTNGTCRCSDRDAPLLTGIADIAADPLAALARGNWLSPGGAL
ncbi:MAG: glycosyltransferase family 2 protein, partial [Burkholderiales bacterium]